jgi:hypothetical protein
MLTQREVCVLVAFGLIPLALAIVGHALQLGGPVLSAVVTVVGVGCITAGVVIGGRDR